MVVVGTPVVVLGNRSAVPAGRRSMAAAAGSWRTVPGAPDRRRKTRVAVVVGMPPSTAAGSWCALAEARGRRYMTRAAAGMH